MKINQICFKNIVKIIELSIFECIYVSWGVLGYPGVSWGNKTDPVKRIYLVVADLFALTFRYNTKYLRKNSNFGMFMES